MSDLKKYYFGPESLPPEEFSLENGVHAYIRYQDYLKMVETRDKILDMYDSQIENLTALIVVLRTEKVLYTWISVDDWLPGKDDLILTVDKDNQYEIMLGLCLDDPRYVACYVTHWMPLPVSPGDLK